MKSAVCLCACLLLLACSTPSQQSLPSAPLPQAVQCNVTCGETPHSSLITQTAFMLMGIILALWYENLGHARFRFRVKDTTDANHLPGRTRFVYILVTNKPRQLPFVPRRTAYSCHGKIEFYSSEDKLVAGPIPIRWSGAPQPIQKVVANNQIVPILEENLVRLGGLIDIPPDETEELAPAVRIYGDPCAYGWTSESYKHNWRDSRLALPWDTYKIRITIISGDIKGKRTFTLANPQEFEKFDLVA